MQTKWILATVFAAATAVSAEANRPKIYYPRNVKRQIDNNNATDIAPVPESTTSKRQFLPGLLDDLFGDSTTTEKDATTTKSNSGILLGPTGIVIPGVIGGDDETDTGPSATNATNTATETDAQTQTQTQPQQTKTQTNADPKPTSTSKEGLLDPLPTLISEIVEPTTKPTTTEGGNGNSTNTEDVKPTTKPTTSSGGGLLDPILNPEPEPTTNTSEEPTSTGGGLLDPLLPEPSDNSTKSDPGPGSTTTSGGGLLDPLPTLITDILSPTSSANSTDPRPTTTSNIISDILPTLLPPESTTSGMISEPIPSLSISIPLPGESTTVSPTDLPGNNTSLPVPTSSPEPTGLPSDPPGNVTDVPTTPLPTLSPTDLPNENSTVSEPTPSVTNTNIHTPVPTTQQPTPTTVISQPPPTTQVESEKPGVTSIRPTATYTNSQDWMPTTIVADPTSFTYVPPTSQPTGTSSQALPTEIPKVILPDDPNKPAPEGTVAIQIGFLFPLNYEFVAKNTVAAAQIFKYLPQALSTAGGFSEDQVVVTKLVPYDTRGKWGYVTTLAKLYYPEALLDTLQMDLWAPNSKIYNSGNSIAEDLTAVINPKIDIFGNIEEEGPNKGDDDDNEDGGSGGDAFDSGDSGNSSSSQKATTAGIAVGAVGLSAMYGAAMFIVARRYKRKRQAHRRTSSITGSDASSDMQYAPNGSPALMGGALLSQDYSNYGAAARESQGSGRTGGNGSARTANISAPVATENSLGWN